MKYLLFLLFVCPLLFACNTTRQTVHKSSGSSGNPINSRQPAMLNHIVVTPYNSDIHVHKGNNTGLVSAVSDEKKNNAKGSIEQLQPLQFKYAILLNIEVELLQHIKLFSFIEEWYGTRYQYGGSTKQGIDCSGFSAALHQSVYENVLSRTTKSQYEQSQKITKELLKEGDLVFFNTRGGVSHVGVYIANNKFVHASTSGGVMISDLNEPYYAKRFLGGGRCQ